MADKEEISNTDLMGMIEKEISVYAFQRPQNGLY
jgi:hypothetical protein